HVTPVLYNASVYRDEAGQAAGVFAAARDITKLKQSEAALIHACNRERFLLNQLKNAMRDGFLLVNLDGTVLELNRNAAALLHVSLPEVTGKPMRSLCDKNRESLVYFIEELLQTGLFVQDREISGGDTGLKWYYSLDLLPLTEDGMTSALVIIRDISRLRKLEYEVTGKYMFENMIGKSPAMRQVFTLIENLADADTTVLIQGPSGTGKELVAGALHYHGKRREEKYIRINCAAIPETLLESELFGHVRGAFTGATHDQIGRFELAHRGTLFIDEVGDIPLHLQVKLLRVLQERELERVGSTKTIKVDVRIIAATNRDLSALVKQNRFREDLYYRLAVVTIRIPPLRERREDIPLLVHHFITQMEKRVGRAITGIDSEAMEILLNHDWPGNVRQLENAIEHALVLTQNGAIHPHNLPLDIMKLSTSDIPEEPELSQSISPQRLREVLAAVNWNRSKAAEQLGVHRNTITRWIKEFHLSKPSD
nr:sigma 54-interacting transcriptional regulator [bacterium]